MKLAQLIAFAVKVMELVNSEQVQQVIALVRDLIEKLAGPKVAGYVAGRLSEKYAPESATFGDCCRPDCDDDDCPCTEEELQEIDAALEG